MQVYAFFEYLCSVYHALLQALESALESHASILKVLH